MTFRPVYMTALWLMLVLVTVSTCLYDSPSTIHPEQLQLAAIAVSGSHPLLIMMNAVASDQLALPTTHSSLS